MAGVTSLVDSSVEQRLERKKKLTEKLKWAFDQISSLRREIREQDRKIEKLEKILKNRDSVVDRQLDAWAHERGMQSEINALHRLLWDRTAQLRKYRREVL